MAIIEKIVPHARKEMIVWRKVLGIVIRRWSDNGDQITATMLSLNFPTPELTQAMQASCWLLGTPLF